jgi:hypothetical protein
VAFCGHLRSNTHAVIYDRQCETEVSFIRIFSYPLCTFCYSTRTTALLVTLLDLVRFTVSYQYSFYYKSPHRFSITHVWRFRLSKQYNTSFNNILNSNRRTVIVPVDDLLTPILLRRTSYSSLRTSQSTGHWPSEENFLIRIIPSEVLELMNTSSAITPELFPRPRNVLSIPATAWSVCPLSPTLPVRSTD